MQTSPLVNLNAANHSLTQLELLVGSIVGLVELQDPKLDCNSLGGSDVVLGIGARRPIGTVGCRVPRHGQVLVRDRSADTKAEIVGPRER